MKRVTKMIPHPGFAARLEDGGFDLKEDEYVVIAPDGAFGICTIPCLAFYRWRYKEPIDLDGKPWLDEISYSHVVAYTDCDRKASE